MQALRSLIFALAGLLVLSACGDDEKATEKAEPTTESTAAWNQEDNLLRLYAWPDYFAPGLISGFEKETGIKVSYESFSNADAVDSVMKKEPGKYDLIMASTSQVAGNLLLELSKDRLDNWKHLDKSLLRAVSEVDPDNRHAMPVFWGAYGVGMEYVSARKALGRAPPEDSWRMLFSLKHVQLFSDCGVVYPNLSDEVINAALIYLGKSARSRKMEDYDAVAKLFADLKPFVRIEGGSNGQAVTQRQACVTMGWSPPLIAAAQEATRAGDPDYLAKFAVPREGTMLWFDMLAIPAAAAHPGNAHKFMDYLMRPEVIAETTNYLGLANANVAATTLVDEMLSTDPNVYPKKSTMEHVYVHADLPKNVRQKRAEVWNVLFK